MSLYLQNDDRLFFGQKSVWLADTDTRLGDYKPGYFPKKMIMSLTSRCNLRCKHCMRDKCADIPEVTMSREMIDHIAEVFFPKISCIQIGGVDFGEQMFSPHFDHFIGRVKEHAVGLDMITNGTLINKDNAGPIASSLSRVMISLEGIGGNYKKIRGVEWDKLKDKISLLLDARRCAQGDSPLIVGMNICALRNFRDDYFGLVDYAKEMGIYPVIVRNFIPHQNSERCQSFLYYEKEHNEFFSSMEGYAKECGVPISVPQPIPLERENRRIFRRKACSLPFEVFGIKSDGKIVTCCIGEAFDLGRFTPDRMDVMDLWLSENYNEIRRTVNSRNPLEPCKVCEAVSYNPLAYRPTPLYLGMKRLFLGRKLPRAIKIKNLAKKAQRILQG
ncbi:MAG: radical SAM protein [Deltaproteobacteria bacterium]|nr:radical SAM protein [Deltaproteobacteria bacterium]